MQKRAVRWRREGGGMTDVGRGGGGVRLSAKARGAVADRPLQGGGA